MLPVPIAKMGLASINAVGMTEIFAMLARGSFLLSSTETAAATGATGWNTHLE